MLARTSSTFHGRDIFSPMGAHIAAGRPFADVGPSLDPDGLVALEFPRPRVTESRLETSVVFVDSFGNLRLAGIPADLEAAVGTLTPGRPLAVEFGATGGLATTTEQIPWARTFGERPLGEPLVYENSFGGLAIAANQGSAAARLGVGEDRPVAIRSA